RGAALETKRIHDAPAKLDVRVIRLAGAVADPKHVGRGTTESAGMGRILARHRLFVAEQERLMAGGELGGLWLRGAFEVAAASVHEPEGHGASGRGALIV